MKKFFLDEKADIYCFQESKVTEEQIEKIKELVSEESIPKMLTYYKIEKIEDMLETDAKDLIARKERSKAKKNENTK